MDDSPRQPLLSSENGQRHHSSENTSFTTAFVHNSHDVPPFTGVRVFFREFYKEFIKLWYIGGPAIFTSVAQYSLGAIIQVFCGHVSTIALAAFTVEDCVIAGFAFGVMMGMGSALETLCGQAFGAGQINILGVYMQRSWVILLSTSCILSLIYIFATAILKLIGQTTAISEAAGTFALYMIPQLFAYAVNFPMAKFLQSQSKIMVMALIAAAVLVVHTLISWFLMLKLGWGLVGAAVVLNVSWWLIDLSLFLYIVSGTCGEAWNGLSWKAFHDLWGFVKLSMASAVMLCFTDLYSLPDDLQNELGQRGIYRRR